MPLRFAPARGASVVISSSSRGPTGPTGLTGATGATGATGSTGSTGATGPGYTATSVTSNSIASSGSKSFTTQSGLAYSAGARVRAADTNAPSTNYMEGVVTSYSGTTLAFTADYSAGSGTLTAWTINLAGDRGATGATGATGPAGSMGGPVSSTDNAVTRFDGTGGTQVQNSGVIIDDSNNVSGVVTLTTSGNIELGNASDTTLSRSSAGVLAVEGVTVALNSTSATHTAGTIELGAASDTTLSRASAGVLAVEGVGLYPNIPQNSQSAAYTTVLGDANKHILHPAADNNARTFTIDSNANVAYPVGTTLTFVNEINVVTIAITSDTLQLAGTATTGSRSLAANGVATAIKVTTTKWYISGTGLT